MLTSLLLIVLIAVVVSYRNTLRSLHQRMNLTETAIANLEAQVFALATRPSGPPPVEPRPRAPAPQPQPSPPLRSRLAAQPPTEARPTEVKASAIILPPGRRLSGPARTGASAPPVAPTLTRPAVASPEPAPAPSASLEEMLGAHWAVYAGGLALALGGVFLVRYSIEAGLIGPGMRIFLGALLAAGLIALGEYFRRKEPKLDLANLPDAHIPSVMTAAGTIVAFGTCFAAYAVYGFIEGATAFVLLGAIGLGTMLAAALHGPALAGLGLAGSYVTPLLIASHSPEPWPVVVYLTAVAGAAYMLARARGWLWLGWTAVAGAATWCFVFLAQMGSASAVMTWAMPSMALVLLQMALAAGFMAVEPHLGTRDQDARPDPIALGALAILTAAGILVEAATPFAHGMWLVFPALMMGLLGLTAWVSAPAAGSAILAAAVGLAVMLLWPYLKLPPDKSLTLPTLPRPLWLPQNVNRFLMFAEVSSLGIAALAALRLWRGRTLPLRVTGLYALAATMPPLLALVLAYLRVTQFDISIPFASAGALLGLVFAVEAKHSLEAEIRPDVNRDSARLTTGAFAAAAIAALSFTLVASLSRGYLTVAFALAALGTAYVSTLKDIPLLRYAVTALGLVVLGRVAWDPRIMGADVGRLPVLNWLLIGYGVPAVAFAVSSRLLRMRSDDTAVRLTDALSVLFAGLLAFFQIHHALNAGDLTVPVVGHLEQGLLAVTALGFTHALTRLDLARSNPVFYYASLGFAAISVVLIAFGLGFDANPYITNETVQGPLVFSSLLPAYLLPGLAALYVARHARGIRPDWYVTAASVLGLLLVFAYVSLEVRHAFHGAHIGAMVRATGPESWAMTVAWLALGIAALAYGLWRGSLEARMASAALIVLVALKVVFIDLADVSGLWRALSFICLGAVLIGIGLVYQRLVFAKPAGGVPRS